MFVQEVLEREIRLSYWEKIKQVLALFWVTAYQLLVIMHFVVEAKLGVILQFFLFKFLLSLDDLCCWH